MNKAHGQEESSIFTRHHKLVTLVGALIVFLTFVVKDYLREEWKQSADAVDTAQYMYAIRSDTRLGETYYKSLSDRLNELRKLILNKSRLPAANGENIILSNMNDVEILDGDVQSRLAAVSILVTKLPSQDANRKKLDDLRTKVKEIAMRTNQIVDEIETADLPKDPTLAAQAFQGRLQRAAMMEGPLSTMAAQLDLDSEAFVTDVLADADSLRERNKVKAEKAKWWGAGFYVLGWFLGLLGSLYGAPKLSAAEQ